MALDLEQFHGIFFEESFEALDGMEQALLSLNDGAIDRDAINTIFRAAHSIKGGSATFGFADVAAFTHTVETLLDLVRNDKVRITQTEIDLLLRSVDIMRGMLSAIQKKETMDPERFTRVQDEFRKTIEQYDTRSSAKAASVTTAPAPVTPPTGGWRISVRPGERMLRSGNDPLRILEELDRIGQLTVRTDAAALPPLAEMDPAVCYLKWELDLQGVAARAEVERVFEWIDADDAAIEIHGHGDDAAPAATKPAASEPAAAAAPEQPPAAVATGDTAKSAGVESTSIRVSIDKLDELINTVGELVITQSILSQLAARMSGPRTDDLKNGLGQLERQMRALQESVMRVRMLPISFVFNRFPRMIRDLGQKLGKKVELRMTGEHTELDKTVLEKIGDPLVHLVRNSIDHGIETTAQRRAAGKPETGTIHLNAYHKGGNITVEIIDDGAGLNRERILAKARERGLVAPDEEPSDDRIYNLIFQPGFSTAEVVSDVSGRGVGMDVVRRNITELGGNVQITSTPGRGSMVRIRLPLTLAILDGQLVRVGRETYVVPLVSIVETIQVRKEQVSSVAGCAELFRLRDEYIPIIRLYKLFGIEGDNTDLLDGLLTIVEADGRRAGIFVDELLAQQQVVIKSLEANFRQLAGISGATMLGDGHVALILDIPGLLARFENGDAGAAGTLAA